MLGIDPGFLSSLFQVIMIDLVLAGDNAVVIGLAAAGLAPDLRRRAILIGILAATGLRIAFALVTTQLLSLGGGLLIAGGLLLLWVCWKMYRELTVSDAEEEEATEALEDADRDALQEDLHADDLLTVVVGLEEPVDELLQGPIHGRIRAELLEVAAEHLDVARLVDDLAGEAELGLDLGHHVEELGAEGERRLLAEKQLRERERPLLGAHPVEVLAADVALDRLVRGLAVVLDRP